MTGYSTVTYGPDFDPGRNLKGQKRQTITVVGELRWDILQDDEGLKWVVDQGASQDHLAVVFHEREPAGESYFDWLTWQFQPGRVFLDVGAHVGMYSVRAAAAGCQVVAVEANPETASFLRMNRELNKLTFPIWAFAAWDTDDTLEISNVPGGVIRSANATVVHPGKYEYIGVTVPARALEDMPWPHDRLDLIKLDVEGSDIHVITGLRSLIHMYQPVIAWEDHSQYHTYTEDDARQLMESFGGYKWVEREALGIKTSDNRWRIGIPARIDEHTLHLRHRDSR